MRLDERQDFVLSKGLGDARALVAYGNKNYNKLVPKYKSL